MIVHPSASDIATALNGLDVALAKINVSIATLPSDPNSPETKGFHDLSARTGEVAKKWAAIITVSEGSEIPTAGDLFFLYTQALNAQSFAAEYTREDHLQGLTRKQIDAVTDAVRAETDLLHITQTLEYAVSDRIDAEEKRCAAIHDHKK